MKKSLKIRNVYLLIIVLLLLPPVLAQTIPTEPEGPSIIDIIQTSRRSPAAASTVPAMAGNVTQLSIIGSTVTQTWQAYYGNISGKITLDDASNNTIYDWNLASPEGEVYASESPVDFTHGNVRCYDFNMTDDGNSAFNTLAEYEELLGLAPDDSDGIDETFTPGTGYRHFYVGSYLIDDVCPTTQLYGPDSQKDPDRFQQVLLYDNTSNKIVYTSIIEQDQLGFDGNSWDFQMIVGENGHDGDITTTMYYFYVELE